MGMPGDVICTGKLLTSLECFQVEFGEFYRFLEVPLPPGIVCRKPGNISFQAFSPAISLFVFNRLRAPWFSRGQMEAALSVGMSRFQALRFIIIPQAIRVILPPMGNEFIALLKDSSLVSAVAVVDLTRRGREYMAAHFNPIEVWVMVGIIYLIMTLFSARVLALIERKLNPA